ncbi:hypothetical protein GCM10028803_47890 [Larkinella knui]|uniref:Uncharacterized protein n=1 Tax=Larkinella knui TaxID=2025310 RepID=A0A3P1CQ42_9BACT|nr:hypothetical protein [Larkinella knui]RRB15368.1 hypothetical protein EHT87_12605 [Larkinella knui]
MAHFFQSAPANTLMALKILLFMMFQNKPLVVFRLSCYWILIRFQVLFCVLLLPQGFYRR